MLPLTGTSRVESFGVSSPVPRFLRLLGGGVGGGEKDKRSATGGSLEARVVVPTAIFGNEVLLFDLGISMLLSISGSTREALSSLCF